MAEDFHRVARLSDIADDEPLGVDLNGRQIALFRIDGEIHATDNICPHQYALLSDGYVEDGCVECPLHQARFDIRSGAVLCGPTDRALTVHAVRIDEGDVLVAIRA
ncbi:non-heme iron oxygenase ferredoxin subunit [Chitinasiproducens palmae]|uniref:3-phenylpropionate/trans-cinnamate dioxygenase ferredoxin subunit n=1 Tax=Chitinasiproducens palmae TaxID=1770053 RepID=A0A1H2PM83_9BURK|nr:non-heme iron oxygenase ferredoxin subunit [Chitinasiproducens palmae]SDV46823.1 3-phenylpropionate/trans-cinnamate dioxygenase ferredoxin subunit [Chitinasiproducens palmae]